jgi:hypothetical protein
MDPQQQQAEIQKFRNLDPQLQQDVMQQVQNVVPQPQQNDMQQFQGMDSAEFQNMDPQQMQDAIQQRVDESLREQMGVTNDADWSLIEEKINAVTKARAVVMADSGIGRMMGMGGMRGGRLGPISLLIALSIESPLSSATESLATSHSAIPSARLSQKPPPMRARRSA